MFIPCEVDITDYVRPGSRELIQVIVENAPDEFAQIGLTSQTSTQKARFTYKWDFCLRLVQLGLYDDVFLEEVPDVTVNHFYFKGNTEGKGSIQLELSAVQPCKCQIKYTLSEKSETVCSDTLSQEVKGGVFVVSFPISVEKTNIWNVVGHGKQNLYDLQISVAANGLNYEINQKVGFRDIRLEKNEDSAPDSLPYTFVVNGKKIYAKGFNLVPLDMNYGAVKESDYRRVIEDIVACNANIVRVWGGGLIESEIFYKLCDEYGILVWQDFIQSSSGIDNFPSSRPEFLALLKRASEIAVKVKRNHPCLAAFCGGNELYYLDWRPVGYENENIGMLRSIVEENSDTFLFPATPSGPHHEASMLEPDRNHDIHGPWQYKGGAAYYSFYNIKKSLLHSEFGSDGLSDVKTIKQILLPENWGVFNNENYSWRHRGEWWNTLERDREVFGENIRTLEDFVAASQYIQAETLRYAVEANRRAAFVNSGSFIWQFNEPVPNVACTSLVDYYGRKKAAYYAVRRAYNRVNPNLRYDKMIYETGEEAKFDLFVTSDLQEQIFKCECYVYADDKAIAQVVVNAACAEGKSKLATSICFKVPRAAALNFHMCISAANGEKFENDVMLLVRAPKQTELSLEPVYSFLKKQMQNQ